MTFLTFTMPIGLIALASLIPLIILYMIRNKPKKKVIPSLMFLMKDSGNIQKFSFFKKFINNFLFFMQLAMLLLLSLAVAAPVMNIPYDATSQNTVLIIDASGSMQAKNGLVSRFDKAVAQARQELSGNIYIILAQETPILILEEGSHSDANDMLTKLNSKATKTNLQDAMLMALDVLGDKRAKVVVLSDFVISPIDDIALAQKTLAARGNKVSFVDVGENEPNNGNVGIIRLDVSKKETKVFVKNFNDKEVTVDMIVEKDTKLLDKKPIRMLHNSIESLTFETVPGISKVKLDINDDLNLDNIAYVSAPDKKTINVLLISNEKSSTLKLALESSSNLQVETVELPVVPKFTHDVIIMHKIDRKLLLPGTFEDISRYVKNGGVFVLTNQNDLMQIDFTKLNLAKLEQKKTGDSVACVDFVNDITKIFGSNRCFAKVSDYFTFEQPKESISLVRADDKTPLVLLKGNIIFYNINDDKSDFNRIPSYPIFWESILRFMTGEVNINEFNVVTGTIKVIEEQDVKTPSGLVHTSKILMDDAGIYEFGNKKIAANMLNEEESNIYAKKASLEEAQAEMQLKTYKAREDFNMENPLIMLVLLIVLFEIFYVKYRGEI